MIAPAPRKPMPVTICAAIRDGSKLTRGSPESRKSVNPYAETIVKSAAPRQTTMCVRKPASRSRSSRSNPIAPPRAAARPSRARSSHQLSVGTALSNKSFERRALRFRDLVGPGAGQAEGRVEQLACERLALGGRLPLDQATVADHHDVHVDLRARILLVVEVEERLAVDDPDRDRGHRAGERLAEPEAVERA